MGNTFSDAAVAAGSVGAAIAYADLKAAVGQFLGYSGTSSNWSTAQSDEIDGYVQAGVRTFYFPPAMDGAESGYAWSFLDPTTTLNTTADDAAQDLPAGFGRMLGDFYYAPAAYRPSIVVVSEAKLNSLLSRSTDTGQPRFACVRHKTQVAGSQQVFEVAWWPIPSDTYTLTYNYEAYSGKLSASNPYPLGGQRYSELVTESCMAIAEQRANDERGLHTDAFATLLRAGIAMDRKQGARYYGPMSAPGATPVPRHGDTGSTYPVTYDGSTW